MILPERHSEGRDLYPLPRNHVIHPYELRLSSKLLHDAGPEWILGAEGSELNKHVKELMKRRESFHPASACLGAQSYNQLDQRLVHQFVGKVSPAACFTNKVLLENSHDCLLCIVCLWLLSKHNV